MPAFSLDWVERVDVQVLLVSENFWVNRIRRPQHGRLGGGGRKREKECGHTRH